MGEWEIGGVGYWENGGVGVRWLIWVRFFASGRKSTGLWAALER
jgi:hypothetical protein